MIITHNTGAKSISKAGNENPAFLLSNKKGGFLYLSAAGNFSRYQGCYFAKPKGDAWDHYKVIEDIRLLGSETTGLRNNVSCYERLSGNAVERFHMNHSDILIYEVENFFGWVNLTLDCRHMYDFDDRGRIYRIEKEDGMIVVSYTKHSDHDLKEKEYSCFLAIKGGAEYLPNCSWEKTFYPFDMKRGSYPYDMYVYNALKIKVDGSIRLVFGYSDSRDEAIRLAGHGSKNIDYLKKSQENYTKSIAKNQLMIGDEEVAAAYISSQKALDNFLVEVNGMKGMFAGFPWFCQFWTRDEAISTKALVLEERFQVAKNILFRHIDGILPDGRVSNRFPHSDLGSADGAGWSFKRIHDLLSMLEDKGQFMELMDKDDFAFVESRVTESIRLLLRYHSFEGLVKNERLETWMDTAYKDDCREGERIEVQALMLSIYRLMRFICLVSRHDDRYIAYSELEEATAERVRQEFFDSEESLLKDGLNDSTIRPNIFLAYYLYPELLKKSEWAAVFDRALESLWLDWGGISTIDRQHRYFSVEYTGEDNRSYHRGDSWFWINNLAAICLSRLDSRRYSEKISRILSASTQEILWNGIIGHHAELSSACSLKSEACLAQAWSTALYIELVHELHK